MVSGTKVSTKRIENFEYILICAREVLRERGDKRTPPKRCHELLNSFDDICDMVTVMENEMFAGHNIDIWGNNKRPLTQKESLIAGRLDINHSQKMAILQPMRDLRKVKSEKRQSRQERLIAERSFAQHVTDADRVRARSFGIRLD